MIAHHNEKCEYLLGRSCLLRGCFNAGYVPVRSKFCREECGQSLEQKKHMLRLYEIENGELNLDLLPEGDDLVRWIECQIQANPSFKKKKKLHRQKREPTELENRARELKRICCECRPKEFCQFKKQKGWPSWCSKRNHPWAFCKENKWPENLSAAGSI